MRRPRELPRRRIVVTLVLGLAGWVVLGYLATQPVGAIFGWSGHPAIPAAPIPLYIGLYLLLFPALCFAAAWRLGGWIAAPRRGEPGG